MPTRNDRLVQFLLVVVFFGGWQLATTLRWLDPFFFPKPSDIAIQIATWITSSYFYHDRFTTLSETVLGYLIGTGLGVGGGIWLGLSPRSAFVLDPFIKALNAIPRVVQAPLFVLWLGLGIWSKVALAVTLVFFITFIPPAGLGYLISQAQGNFNPTGVFAGIVILAAFVLLIDVVLDFVEKRLITWRPKVQQTQTT
jgi:ABC-type nitrate/sulfonate/bicarbonate transport system permease component